MAETRTRPGPGAGSRSGGGGTARATASGRTTATRTAKPETGGRRRAAAPAGRAAGPEEERHDGHGRVRWEELPLARIRVPVVHLPMSSARPLIAEARWVLKAAASALPPPPRLLYYGGVGVLAALGVLEWPVAGALAVGLWIAGRRHTGGAPAASAA
ncbi:hypothetical protein ABT297_23435 [Dactylosporangium sp. NPDC000555]|uniref:hypothetical protein n=1 Tax=Dactylosporangium sp. NPDC000555 TaxID=3154260 RepID=UPI00331CEFE1